MHKIADDIQANIRIPLLHIADPTAQQIKAAGIQEIGLLGTRFTMEQDFYKGRLSQKYGLNVHIPDPQEREIVHRIIYDELVVGKIRGYSKEQYLNIIQGMAKPARRFTYTSSPIPAIPTTEPITLSSFPIVIERILKGESIWQV